MADELESMTPIPMDLSDDFMSQPVIYGPIIDLNVLVGTPPNTRWTPIIDPATGLLSGWRTKELENA